jgi:hypothetical protein
MAMSRTVPLLTVVYLATVTLPAVPDEKCSVPKEATDDKTVLEGKHNNGSDIVRWTPLSRPLSTIS